MSPKKYRTLYHKCEKCISTFDLLVHHIDHNRKNNKIENLQVLCTSCHAIIHKRIRNITRMRRFYITHPNQLMFNFYIGIKSRAPIYNYLNKRRGY